jgi:hypothetical protein
MNYKRIEYEEIKDVSIGEKYLINGTLGLEMKVPYDPYIFILFGYILLHMNGMLTACNILLITGLFLRYYLYKRIIYGIIAIIIGILIPQSYIILYILPAITWKNKVDMLLVNGLFPVIFWFCKPIMILL